MHLFNRPKPERRLLKRASRLALPAIGVAVASWIGMRILRRR